MAGLSFLDLLRAREGTQNKSAKPPNCILVWLDGGPSHYESFDSKLEKVSGEKRPCEEVTVFILAD